MSKIDFTFKESQYVTNVEDTASYRRRQLRELKIKKIPRAPFIKVERHDVNYYGNLPYDYNIEKKKEEAVP